MEKPLDKMNILELIEYYMEQGYTEEQAEIMADCLLDIPED